MFVWPVAPWASIAINVLLVLWAGLHLFGFLLGRPNADGTSRMFPLAKMASSAALVVCALLFWVGGARGTPLAAFSALLFFGMFFGFLGDLTLAGFLRLPQEVVFGMLWFGIGHVLYIVGFLTLGLFVFGLRLGGALLGAVAAWMIVAGVIWRVLVASPETPPILNYGALGYGLLLGAMTGVATSLAVQNPAFVRTAAGAALFLLSDMILGNALFRKNKTRLIHDVIWVLYIVGQLFIVFTNAAVLRLMG